MLSLSQLRTPVTRAEALTFLSDVLNSLGFDTTGWQDGRIPKTVLVTSATLVADFSELIKFAVDGSFNAYAKGDLLNLFSQSRFDNTKTAAVATVGPMLLTSTSSVPYPIAVGELVAATSNNVLFRNTTGGTLAAGSVASPSTLSLTWQAVLAGESGNVANGAVTRLVTPLAGVTISNSVGSPWYSTEGANEESDASIRARNRTKWATFALDAVAETYEHIARQNGATKVLVNDTNPRGPGTVDIYAAGDSSLLGTSTMEAIQLAYSLRAFQTDATWATPWPVGNTSRAALKHPPEQPLGLTGTVYFDPSEQSATISARVQAALQEFLRTLPIGGKTYSSGVANVVLREDLVEVFQNVEGVRTVVLTTPSSTTPVSPLALVTAGTWSLTYEAANS